MKHLSSLLFAFLFTASLSAQGFEKRFAPGDKQNFFAVQPTADGGNLMAGAVVPTGVTASEILLVKTDADGNLQWEKQSARNGVNYARSIAPTADGNFAVTGAVNAPGGWLDIFWWKISPAGDSLDFRTFDASVKEIGYALVPTGDGGFVIAGTTDSSNLNSQIFLLRMDSTGTETWRKTYGGPGKDIAFSLAGLPDGGFAMTGTTIPDTAANTPADIFWMKINADGDSIFQKKADFGSNDLGFSVHILPGGDWLIGGESFIPSFGAEALLLRTSPAGDTIFTRHFGGTGSQAAYSAIFSGDGNLVLAGRSQENVNFGEDFSLWNITPGGDLLWQKTFPRKGVQVARAISAMPGGGFAFVGGEELAYEGEASNSEIAWLCRTDELGNTFPNHVLGKVFYDRDLSCHFSPGDEALREWLVLAKNQSGEIFYAATDTAGNYDLTIDTGSFSVRAYLPSDYWGACLDSVSVNFTTTDTVLVQDFGAQNLVDCPQLEVEISTGTLRRCFDNVWTLRYCNRGTATAVGAFVDVQLDTFIHYVSADLAPTVLTSHFARFQLGDLEAGDCGAFTITANLDCDSTVLGQAHCVEAHIFPDSFCVVSPDWSGADIRVRATCTDSVRFFIENRGTADMPALLGFIVIEEVVMFEMGNFQLQKDETLSIPAFPANGSTWRIVADQEPSHPGNSMPTVALEGCRQNFDDPFSLGFFTQFPDDDGDPFRSADCRQSIGSWDPNDKTGFPAGVGTEHFISPTTELDYLIRFQNTGTDTAFNVTIRDTLSQNLDPLSLRPGTASHDFSFNMLGNGVAVFSFKNINLPDSTTHEAASHGFVQFRASPKKDLPPGTLLPNRAAIFFDFNAPVLTNETQHRIGQTVILFLHDDNENESGQSLRVFPNPVRVGEALTFDGIAEARAHELVVFSADGRSLKTIRFFGKTLIFKVEDMLPGLCFFRILENGTAVGSGKMVVLRE